MPTPPGGILADGTFNAQILGESIRAVCMQVDPRIGMVMVGITGCDLVARVMEIPPVPDADVRAVLRGEMDHYRILPSGQSAFDFCRLPEMPTAEGETREEAVARVLLMGTEERVVGSYRSVVDASNMNLMAMEPGSIAVLRALYPLLNTDEAIATVILSGNSTDIFVTQQSSLQFYRQVDTGLSELRNEGGQVTAGASRPMGGMLAPDTDYDAPDVPVAATAGGDNFNRQAISLLMTEVQRSIDYFLREFPAAGEKIKVQFAIDASYGQELFTILRQHLRSEAQLVSVVDAIELGSEAMHLSGGHDGYRYTVAAGLALRGALGEYEGAPTLDLAVGDKVTAERRGAPKAFMISAAASAVIFLGTVAAAISVGYANSAADRSHKQIKAELDALTKEHSAKVAALDRQAGIVTAIGIRNRPLRQAVEFISASVASKGCLTTLMIDKNGTIMLSGEALTPRVVADIMDTINRSTALEPVKLISLSRLQDNMGARDLKFDLQTSFLKPVIPTVKPAGSAAPPAATKH